ncbi:modin [Colletotrichum truncatum]|uniref:Modin n=1 Tax=Colletotrichum truncatum TaxID=5467 RepID=A0ACC3YPL0_COLTU|nr:modin [Colletotrichum truncatum]KAF6796904.1 modin [Colletotrichum truncatum]
MSDNDNDNELRVAGAALAIAIAAFLAAMLQLVQALFASARGLPNCDKRVIGDWAQYTVHRLRLKQLRLEVEFEAPVIFLAPESQTKGPVKDEKVSTKEVWHAEGTQSSCKMSRISWNDDVIRKIKEDGTRSEEIHTVDNARATWVWLLVAVERMEKESKEWENFKQNLEEGQPEHDPPTLTVKMQVKKTSFDTNPEIKKPFATTTISHLVELAAVLGLYWKVFDRDDNRYRAEGNGYSLTGSRISDFGVVFVFEKTGPTVFEANRIIPTSEVKELCFGRVPTLYRPKSSDKPEDLEWQNIQKTSSGNSDLKVEILQLGSRDEIAETLTQIGCNVGTTLFYKDKNKHQHDHLFPVTFEVMGMLARTLHIKDRCFTFLPNPTIYRWSRDSFSILRLLGAFTDFLERDHDTIRRANTKPSEEIKVEFDHVDSLSQMANTLWEDLETGGDLTYHQMNHLHKAIDLADSILTAGESPSTNQTVVLDVLRRHLQEVLAAINKGPEKDGNRIADGRVSFSALFKGPLEKREQRFMEIYFDQVLLRVVPTTTTDTESGDQEQVSRAIHEDRIARSSNGHVANGALPFSHTPSISPTDPSPGLTQRVTWPKPAGAARDDPKLRIIAKEPIEMQRLTIWYTLVFRMICWLMLHDFDKRDVQVPNSDLMGNRQPVFIT